MSDSIRPTCGTCPFYDAEAKTRTYDESFAGSMIPQRPIPAFGLCKLDPRPIHKVPTDWCGEHPDFPAWIETRRGTA